jgi:PadR family transcriptional regulator AphA
MSLTTTEAALLGLLRKRPMSGYDLRKEVEKSVAYFWAPAKTQIYATLPKLVQSGYASEEKVVQETRPDKRIYAITDEGREALREWIEDAPLDAGQGRNLILLKIYFGAGADVDALRRQLAERRADAQKLRRELEELDAIPGARKDPFQTLTRRWGFLYADALVRWTEEADRELGKVARRANAPRRAPRARS